jgi:formate/nitrite transporter FocA (FNT family)
MGFSMVAKDLLRAGLPDKAWSPLLTSFGYSLGFLIIILGRQQLFSESTLTAMLPVLYYRDLASVGRLALVNYAQVASELGPTPRTAPER